VPGQEDPANLKVANTSAWCGVAHDKTVTESPFDEELMHSPARRPNTAAGRYVTMVFGRKPWVVTARAPAAAAAAMTTIATPAVTSQPTLRPFRAGSSVGGSGSGSALTAVFSP
jgi:hypothetical protein